MDRAVDRGPGRPRDVFESHERSIVRLRLTALVMTLAVAVVAMRLGAPQHALWMLPVLPLYWSGDFCLCGLAESYRAVDAQETHGVWDMASVHEIATGSHRNEFYSLLGLASMVVALRG